MALFSKVKDIFKSTSSVKRKKVYHNVKIQNPADVWIIKSEIGDGAYGKVYKAENIHNGTLAALKKVALEEDEDLDNFMVEIDILAECQHANVVRLLEAYHWEGCLWMYLEFCDGGAVDSIMVDLDRPLTEEQISYITHHLLQALDYVHRHRVIHRDIKAGNVLLTTDGGVKLADFGVSAKNKNTMDKRGTFIGTPYWLAPEVIKCETIIDSKYDYKADIWSLGITLIEFAQMDPPYHEVSPLRVLLKIQKSDPPKLDCPSKFSRDFNDFIASCLVKNPDERPDARQLMNHPFVKKPQNAKHIIALLIEYQADVVEEDVEEDPRASRLSLDSVDQHSLSQDSESIASKQQKEATPTGVTERRATKGPAPPPPPAPSKKGPAPSTPSPAVVTTPSTFPAPASSSTPTITPGTAVTSSLAVTSSATSAPIASPVTSPSIDLNVIAPSPLPSADVSPPPPVSPSVSPLSPVLSPDPSSQPSVPVASSDSPKGLVPQPPSVPTTTTVSSSPPDSGASSSVNNVQSPSSVPVTSPAAYIATVTSSVRLSPSVETDVVASSSQNDDTFDSPPTGKDENLSDSDSKLVPDDPLINSPTTKTLPSPAFDSTITTAIPTSSGDVVLSGASPEVSCSSPISYSTTSVPVAVVSSSGVSVSVPEAPLDAPQQSMALPLSVVSASVCVATADVASTSTADTSMVSITTLGDDMAVETVNIVPQEKLVIEENEDVSSFPVIPPSVIVDSTSKTHIISDGFPKDIQDGHCQPSSTVVSIGDPMPDIRAFDHDVGTIADALDVCGSIDDALDESLYTMDREEIIDGYAEPSLPTKSTSKPAETRQRSPDDLPSNELSIVVCPDAPDDADADLMPQTITPAADHRTLDVPVAQIIASIGSEGTVIVRTPTPTPQTPTPPTSTPPPQQSLVTFSGPGVVESPTSTPLDSPRAPPLGDESYTLAAEEAVQLLDEVIDHHETSSPDQSLLHDSTLNESTSSVVVVDGPRQVVISHSHTLDGESNTDDVASPTRVAGKTHISVVPVAEHTSPAPPDALHVTIEGTTLGDTDVDSLVTPHKHSKSADAVNGRDAPVAVTAARHALEDRSDSDSISTVSSEKENSKPTGVGGGGSSEEEVVLRHPTAGRSPSTDTSSYRSEAGESMIEDSTLKNVNRQRQSRQAIATKNGRTKEENESIALRKKTRKRTRKFMIDGVVMTTTTSKVIYGDDEEGNIMTSGHLARKQELRELKLLQKIEQKQFQELGIKANNARIEQERKFEAERSQLVRTYDNDVDTLNRHQKQQVERTEAQHEVELKSSSKRIRADQEKELRSFRDSLKIELKLLKQEVDLLPKDVRKEALRSRKEHLESDQAEREKAFLERLHQNHESSMKRLSEEHRAHVALLERQFLQKKHQMLRAREAALWELEERHLHERHQLAKRQLKDIFFLQRHQMLLRHEKELEQVRRQNCHREEELIKRQAIERRAMPKRIRQEMKARELMFRESLRISTTNLPESHQDEKERLRKFQMCERRRYEAERKRADQKHKKQLEELQAATEAHAKELEQMQNEKRKMLMEHETLKLKAQEEEYQKELKDWKNNLKPRKQKLEDEFEQQLLEQEEFYGAYLTTNGTTLLSSAADAPTATAY
ncbi:serine/threonine-protein kinase 10 isoform X1 [Hyalella azteca]|uniref:Serine/threonine-protein kinase 10 isoform X1 n=2 Tax=Hyalella azteca TaxID=294128 RepID=A0A8B7NR34_HYAAZ|nr:serine/threonine-protein kinase 10 isoform X1 [Hyalella azteca]